MRRTIAILFLSWATALTATSCGSATDPAATGPTTTTGKTTTTTAKANPAAGSMDEKKCSALDGYLESYLIAARDESKAKENQDKVLKGVGNTAATLKKALPSVATEVDTVTAYLTKLVKSEATTPADKDASDKAKNKITFFHNSCPKDGAAGGPTTTAKAGAPTTTAKK